MDQHSSGLIVVYTGDGKGKSSAAFGTAIRALGFGKKCAVIQFIKGPGATSESKFFSTVAGIAFHSMGKGFTWESKNLAEDKRAATEALSMAIEYLQNPDYWTVVLDEITYAVNYHFIEIDALLNVIAQRSPETNVVITGRDCPQELIDIADSVTIMQKVKHPFDKGIHAQRGIDF